MPEPIQKAIIHKATRVIRRITIDLVPPIAKDEEIIELSAPLDLTGGFWKLDLQNKLVKPTEAEIDESGVDDEKEAAKREAKNKEVENMIIDFADNGVTLLKLQDYFKILKSRIN